MALTKQLAAFLLASVVMVGLAGCDHHRRYDDHHPPPPPMDRR
jgi:uncharacterized lipoprotein YehR (DUF1307 family)